jgi:hypothetical protein
VSDSISPEKYEKWKEMKYELHYIPEEEMTEDKQYPGWKKKPDKKYTPDKQWGIEFFEESKNSQNGLKPDTTKLTGGWVLIDTRQKPPYKDKVKAEYPDNDPLAQAIEELRAQGHIAGDNLQGNRFRISWEELQKPEVKAKLAEILEVDPDQIRLPRAIEWNFLGNAYYEKWGTTDTYEWFQEEYQSSGHLIGGSSDDGGLSGVHWDPADSRHGNIGFRPVVIFQ